MDARTDPNYLRLYREYANAIQGFENAVRDRRRVRNRLAVKRSPVLHALEQWQRRPVGSSREVRVAREPEGEPQASPKPHARHIYLGEIHGWATVVPSGALEVDPDFGPDLDAEELYDRLSLELYWNARSHYHTCKRAFFDYVRRQNIALHRAQAREALAHGADRQLLGLDDQGKGFLEEARREVERACESAWKLYQSSPSPKSFQAKVLLAESIADAQYVDLGGPTVQAMESELSHQVSCGAVKHGEQ